MGDPHGHFFLMSPVVFVYRFLLRGTDVLGQNAHRRRRAVELVSRFKHGQTRLGNANAHAGRQQVVQYRVFFGKRHAAALRGHFQVMESKPLVH